MNIDTFTYRVRLVTELADELGLHLAAVIWSQDGIEGNDGALLCHIPSLFPDAPGMAQVMMDAVRERLAEEQPNG